MTSSLANGDEVEVRALRAPEACHRCSELYAEVWGLPTAESPMAGEVLIALAHSGNYVVGAFTPSGTLVGAAAAWFAIDEQIGTHFLHSHIAAVTPEAQGLGVGRALKEHQRRWCLDRGLAEVRWTFDPLVRRNAWINLTRLGAVGVRYVEDFYGLLDDAINAGEPTDRMVVHWSVHEAPMVDPPAHRAPGAYPVLESDRSGGPVVLDEAPPHADLAVWLPEDIEALRRTDLTVARRWRAAQRSVLVPAFDRGYRAIGVSPDGWLRLSRPEPASSRP